MGTHPIFESDFDCLTDCDRTSALTRKNRNMKATNLLVLISAAAAQAHYWSPEGSNIKALCGYCADGVACDVTLAHAQLLAVLATAARTVMNLFVLSIVARRASVPRRTIVYVATYTPTTRRVAATVCARTVLRVPSPLSWSSRSPSPSVADSRRT